MADRNDLKRAFARELNKKAEDFLSNEERLLSSIAKHLGGSKVESVVQGYNTEEVLSFLEKPIPEIKEIIGGEWKDMSDADVETVIYSLSKKVKKSADFFG